MSKKSIIVIVSIVLVVFSISMLLSAFVFRPKVKLDMGYDSIDTNFYLTRIGEDPVPQENDFEITLPIRFSHYAPPVPYRYGYTFAGWYKDIGYTVAWINGEDTVTRDISLYAKWVKAT